MDWPIDPSAVVSLDGFRKHHTDKGRCKHERYLLDVENGVVNCADCDAPVSAFHALKKIAFHESQAFRKLSGMKTEIAEISGRRSWLRAVKNLDRLWRGRSMLPCCPFCHRGLYAEDFSGASVGVEYEKSRRLRDGIRVPQGAAQDIPSPD